jgi:Xaa-Pro aminopeptidase
VTGVQTCALPIFFFFCYNAVMMVKTPEQVAMIEEVQRAVEDAAGKVIEYLKTDRAPTSEKCHTIIDEVLASYGCESPEGHIVAGGLQSAEPHNEGNGILLKGTPIVIDIYPRSKTTGYFADMSRTVCLGAPPERLQKMHDAVLAVQELAIGMVRPGTKCIDIQNAVETYFTEQGFMTSGKGKEFAYAEGFVHGIGHGVGLKIHEAPRIGRGSQDILAEGDVITIEPGLYYKDTGGVRIEDMVLVTKDGCRNLTTFPKQFIV